jgi:hypothetical protein
MGDKAALLAYRTMLSQVHGLIAEAKHKDQTVKQVADSDAFKAINKTSGNGFLKGPRFLGLLFTTVD